jgi:hypothetical protein
MKNARLLLRTCLRELVRKAHDKAAPLASARSFAASSSSSASGQQPSDQQQHNKTHFQPRDVDSVRKEIASPHQIRQDHAYCVNLVRERDREGYRKSPASLGLLHFFIVRSELRLSLLPPRSYRSARPISQCAAS